MHNLQPSISFRKREMIPVYPSFVLISIKWLVFRYNMLLIKFEKDIPGESNDVFIRKMANFYNTSRHLYSRMVLLRLIIAFHGPYQTSCDSIVID